VLAYVPHAPDADTVVATERRLTAERLATPPRDPEPTPMSIPATWTSSHTSPTRPGISPRSLAVAAATMLTLGLAAGGVWWLLHDREVPVAGGAAETATATPAPAPTPAAPVAPPEATVTPSAPAPGTPAPPVKPGSAAPATARVTPPGTTPAPPGAPATTTTAAVRPAASKALVAQAATLLSEAQGLLQTGAEADGLAKIAALRASFGGTPAARDGALLAARTHQQARRYDDAAAAWIDAARDGVGPEEISEGLIQAADGAARQRSTDGDTLARRTLGEILDRYPASVRALRALQMKMSIEDRMKLKEPDGELNGIAPASLLTLRRTARGAGTAPVAEFALWRLGQEYRDRRLYDLAAATFSDLGTRFPETRYDAWFSAAELFEKQLKDTTRAREAYAKVPAASPRYEAAQKKLT
jgi:TolA-binding protein